ncbi:unnamed protein product [Adineta steineri]|uniref:Arf-GAP domain-containing protein n=1 Tax=Adineta steineri TaxID=433720 RepID=A0A818PDW3_9BILA|nr:unnamed protein product [Adineta steineri]
MAVRSEREKSKMQEKYQVILSQMLKEEDNKYCVDCDTKSPRWASWNIGVFICIRCAGFHRNLGVHISKVKSVNLDSWTSEQIASMQAMGNSRARAVYEANLPDGFRRPQSDSTLEAFIRAKYEQRKWIAKEWIPPEITVPIDLIESETHQRKIETTSDSRQMEKHAPKIKPFATPATNNNPVQQTGQISSSSITTPIVENNNQNLLNLDEPLSSPTNNVNSTAVSSSNILDPLHELFTTATSQNSTNGNTTVQNIDKDLESAFYSSNDSSANHSGVMTNEKIMALFNTPQTSVTTASGMNIRPISTQHSTPSSSGFVYPPPAQHSPFVPPQKSVSFGNNLYQQATNFGSQIQQNYPYSVHPAMAHNNPNIQNSTSTFTHDQFSQFMPFTNTKMNTSTGGTFIANTPMRPITEYMTTSSDSLWQ